MSETTTGLDIAVVGATGQVGSVMRRLLEERDFPVKSIRFFASARSAGTTLPFRGQQIIVEDVATADVSGIDIALFSAGATGSKAHAPRFAEAGAIVIDNSSGWRMDPDVPLVVSEVNPEAIADARKGIIANPNCTTMAAMPVLKVLHEEAGLQRLIVSTYQAVSGSGLAGAEELAGQIRTAVADENLLQLVHDGSAVTMPDPVTVRAADRVRRHPAGRLDRRRRPERDRRGEEAPQREPQDPRPPRPPGERHLRARAGLHRALAVDQRRVRVARSPRSAPPSCSPTPPACVLTDVPTPLEAAGQDPSFVGRIRADEGAPEGRGLALFISNDNLRKGAALNAVQIAELVAERLSSRVAG